MQDIFSQLANIGATDQLAYLKRLAIAAGADDNATERGMGQPCIDCGGTDRMTVSVGDRSQKAAIFCRVCTPRGEDLIGSVVRWGGAADKLSAARMIADDLGIVHDGGVPTFKPLLDPVGEWCDEKGICRDTFAALWNPAPYRRGQQAID